MTEKINNAGEYSFSDCTIDNIIYDTSSWFFDRPKALANRHSDHNMLYATAYFK